jgi:hypothetical protein
LVHRELKDQMRQLLVELSWLEDEHRVEAINNGGTSVEHFEIALDTAASAVHSEPEIGGENPLLSPQGSYRRSSISSPIVQESFSLSKLKTRLSNNNRRSIINLLPASDLEITLPDEQPPTLPEPPTAEDAQADGGTTSRSVAGASGVNHPHAHGTPEQQQEGGVGGGRPGPDEDSDLDTSGGHRRGSVTSPVVQESFSRLKTRLLSTPGRRSLPAPAMNAVAPDVQPPVVPHRLSAGSTQAEEGGAAGGDGEDGAQEGEEEEEEEGGGEDEPEPDVEVDFDVFGDGDGGEEQHESSGQPDVEVDFDVFESREVDDSGPVLEGSADADDMDVMVEEDNPLRREDTL